MDSVRDPAQEVVRRRVFYIPGYDPIPPRRYRELYRTEAAQQAQISGYAIDLRPKPADGTFGWMVDADIDGAQVAAQVDVLVWSDLVQRSMSGSIPATYLHLMRTAAIYIGSGALWRLMKLRKGPVIAALYPVAMLVLQLVVAVGLGWTVAGALIWAADQAGAPAWVSLAAWGVGVGAAWLALRWFKARDNRIFAYYLMHDYAYSAQAHGALPVELAQRLRRFEDQIAAALQSDAQEVLVVGHSSGAHLGVSVLASLIRAGRVPGDGPRLAFLSLGQVVPMVSFLPRADGLRRDLRDLASSDRVTWVDVSAPGDGCAFALCDPVAVSGVAVPDRHGPLVLSAAFTQTLSPARWKALRWRFFRLHFQYLCAFDQPGDYDYFQITAGPQTLATRFAGRAPSRSRIERALSPHVSVAPA